MVLFLYSNLSHFELPNRSRENRRKGKAQKSAELQGFHDLLRPAVD